jgi:hypothetical protein
MNDSWDAGRYCHALRLGDRTPSACSYPACVQNEFGPVELLGREMGNDERATRRCTASQIQNFLPGHWQMCESCLNSLRPNGISCETFGLDQDSDRRKLVGSSQDSQLWTTRRAPVASELGPENVDNVSNRSEIRGSQTRLYSLISGRPPRCWPCPSLSTKGPAKRTF